MRLPSVDRLARGAAATLRRFPVALLAAAVATTAALALIDGPGSDVWERLLASSTLGLPLFFALTLLAERRGWGAGRRAALHLAGAAALAGVYLAWPGWSHEVAVRRYAQLSAGFHLVAAFLPFVGVREQNGFWQYNRSLFLRFLTAALYAGVLFAGLALALAALEHLFGVGVSGDAYARLWIVVALLFHPWFFLAGVPADLAALESVTEYPRGLKVFTQYVLVPLVLVYLAILTAYAVKVMATWDWPSGWIGWLVSGVAVAGILALLLVHPVRRRAENAWVRAYGRWFWVALLPSVVLLLLAIRQRVSQYGLTENRYFLLVLALWLAGISAFYALRRSDDIQHVPRTLAVVVLVTFLGPWSAYAVSERSQRGRLASLLARHGLVVDGEVHPARDGIPFEDRREISATVRYLVQHHGVASVAPAFGGEVPRAAPGEPGPGAGPVPEVPAGAPEPADRTEPPAGADTSGRDRPPPPPERRDRDRDDGAGEPTPEEIVAALGIDYVNAWEGRTPDRYVSLVSRRSMATRPLAGYDHVVFRIAAHERDTLRVAEGLRVTAEELGIRILRDDGRSGWISVAGLARRLDDRGYGSGRRVPDDEMWIETEAAGLRAALWIESLRARRTGAAGLENVAWSGHLFLGEPARSEPEAGGPEGG